MPTAEKAAGVPKGKTKPKFCSGLVSLQDSKALQPISGSGRSKFSSKVSAGASFLLSLLIWSCFLSYTSRHLISRLGHIL